MIITQLSEQCGFSIDRSDVSFFADADVLAQDANVNAHEGCGWEAINDLLNPNGGVAARALAGLSGAPLASDKAHGQILAGLPESFRRDLDFSNQADREAIGLALVNYIRKTGGCDVSGGQAHGCGP